MENSSYIEIKIKGFNGNVELSPDNFDIRELVEIVVQTEKLLFPGECKERPLISYHIEEGSVRNIFKTNLQIVLGFSAVLGQIYTSQNIDFLELNSAKAIEIFQDIAVKKDYSFELTSSLPNSSTLKIDKNTFLYRTKENWVDAEFYFYGRITNAGGKEKVNIHLSSSEYGTLIIQTPQEFLANAEENILYKFFGVRAKGKQNSDTGEIDKSSLVFLELLDYNKIYSEKYIQSLRAKAMKWLTKINPDDWMNDIRGYNA